MAEDNKKAEAGVSKLAGVKVLILEDDVFLGGVILRHMLNEKMQATLIATGEGAVEEIKKALPEVIVLDIFLPGMNGLEILEAIRKEPTTSKIPVLVVSNTDQIQDREKVKSLKASFMIKAMVTPAKITEQIEEILRSAK